MYQQDSFFDLSVPGQFGLLAISLALSTIFVMVAWTVLRHRAPWVRVIGALTLFWIFVWVSPQVYYQYYHLFFENLPNQWVIFPPPAPLKAVQFLIFQGPQNLSAHGQGALGWCLLVAPFLRRRNAVG